MKAIDMQEGASLDRPEVVARSALEVMRADLCPVAGVLEVRLFDPSSPGAEADDVIKDPASWLDEEFSANPPMLLVVNNNVRAFERSLDLQKMLVDFASYLQDEIIDLTGAPWPQVFLEGRYHILEPRFVDGVGLWCDREEPYRPIGGLWD